MTLRHSIQATGIVLVLFLLLANFNCQTGAIPNNAGANKSGANNSDARTLEGGSAPTYGVEVVNTWPHDTDAYTQGLVFQDGNLLESTGREGKSSLRRIELETARVLQKVIVPSPYFAEGITLLKGRIFQLTWQHQRGFIYDPSTFAKLGEFTYSGEGWGLTNDGDSLILSDGTNRLRFLDPVNFQLKKSIAVFDGRRAITNLNELEFVQSEVYANVWHTDRLARIDPQTGRVAGWIDLKGLLSRSEVSDEEAVLNGIAYDETRNRLFVTGKLWPKLFEIRLVQNRER
jgi:glutaminyl-peptide cyclotransferase